MSREYVERRGSVAAAADEYIAWERSEPVYRVFLRGLGQTNPQVAWTYDVTGVTAATVLEWARQRSDAGNLAHAVALVCDRPPVGPDDPGVGLIWLVPWTDADEVDHEWITDSPRADHHRMLCAISVAWLGMSLTSAMCRGMDLAWELLVDREEWRDWVEAVRRPAAPFLYLAVRDELDQRRHRKTRDGASLQLPAAEVEAAHREGTLIRLYLGVIHDIHAKWAASRGLPAPPVLHG